MSIVTEIQPVLDEEVWRAWIQKGKLREAVTARKAKALGGILMLLAVGSAFYVLAVR